MKVSLVTPTLNQAATLPQTLRSVLAQDIPGRLEHIVLDACSTDGTDEIIRSMAPGYLQKGVELIYIREPDAGQADAINKGWRRATGDILGYLNSDDYLLPGALAKVLGLFESRSDVAWAYGGWQLVDEVGRIHATVQHRAFSRSRLLNYCNIGQPSCFFRRSLFERVGELDPDLHLAMDYDLWLRFLRHSEPMLLPEILSAMRYHSAAKSSHSTMRQIWEVYRVAARHTRPVSWRRLMQVLYAARGSVAVLLRLDVANRIHRQCKARQTPAASRRERAPNNGEGAA